MYYYLNILIILSSVLYMVMERNIVRNQRTIIYKLLVLSAILLFAFRPEDSKDTLGYIASFNNIDTFSSVDITFLQKFGGYELGYIYLIRFFGQITDSYRIFFLFISGTGLIMTLWALNRMTNKSLKPIIYDNDSKLKYLPIGAILALYISCYGYLYNGISVRAGISIGLGLVAFYKMQEKKVIKSIFLFFLAFSLQRTSFLFVIAFFIYQFVPILKKKTHLIIWLVTGFTMFSGIASYALTFINVWLITLIQRFGISGYDAYLSSLDVAVGLTDIYKWLLYGLLIFICDNKEKNQKYLNVVMIGALIVVFMHDVRAVSRAYDLFYLFIIPLLSDFYYGKMDKVRALNPFRKIIVHSVIIINAIVMLRTSF